MMLGQMIIVVAVVLEVEGGLEVWPGPGRGEKVPVRDISWH